MTDYQDSSIARVEEVLKGLTLDVDHYREVMLRMQTAMENGLSTASRSRSSIKMYPTYVTKLPSGNGMLCCSCS